MSTAPAQPMHDTDHESSWWRGTVWSLASKARTDWWKTSRQRSTMTPVDSERRDNGCVSSLLNCIHVSLTCVLSLSLSPTHHGCMERCKEPKMRREEMRKDVLREMRRPFFGGITWSNVSFWWQGAAGFAAESGYTCLITMYILRKWISWLISKGCICFWHFVLLWQSQQNVTSRQATPASSDDGLSSLLLSAGLKFMKVCNNNHVLCLIWHKTKDQLPFARL